MVQLGRRNAELVSIGWTPPNGNNLAVVFVGFCWHNETFFEGFCYQTVLHHKLYVHFYLVYLSGYSSRYLCFNDLFSIELRLNLYTFTHLSTLHFPLWEVLKVHFCSAKTCIFYLQHYFSYLCILSSSAIEASYAFCPVEAFMLIWVFNDFNHLP